MVEEGVRVLPVILIYGGGGALLLILAVVFYLRSVSSRKFYVCPHCGERQRVELMDAQHCSSCGSDLQRE